MTTTISHSSKVEKTYQETCKRFGTNVRRLRKERGWSIVWLAQNSGLHRNYISEIERGERNPTIKVICDLAVLFGTRPESLLKIWVRKRTRPVAMVENANKAEL